MGGFRGGQVKTSGVGEREGSHSIVTLSTYMDVVDRE